MENNENTCWACKRILVGNSKLGLCPDCMNKYGSAASTVGVFGICGIIRFLIKNSDKALKIVAKGIEAIRG